MPRFIIMLLIFDCSKLVLSKQNIAKRSLMSFFTIPLYNVVSMILFVNMWLVIVALVFVTLVGLFITGKRKGNDLL